MPFVFEGLLICFFGQHIFREIEILQMLDPFHPNIAPLLDCFQAEGTIYLVFPYYKEGDLYDYMCVQRDLGRELDEEEIRRFMVGVLNGVRYLHSMNVIHRDIKGNHFPRKHCCLNHCSRSKYPH
jgi:serine/threonine protein kinase